MISPIINGRWNQIYIKPEQPPSGFFLPFFLVIFKKKIKMDTENVSEYDGVLIFEENFEDFACFYSTTKDPIFKEVLRLFKLMVFNEKKEVSIFVYAKIKNISFSSNLTYDISNIDIMSGVLLPYFEEKEEYETCEIIVEMLGKIKPK